MRRSNAERIVGLDVHPDSFAGAILQGRDPWKARVVSTSTRVALPLLEKWALRHTRESDCLVMEASGNAFAVAERLRRAKKKGAHPGQSQCGQSGKNLLRDRSSGCDQDCAHLLERALTAGVATGRKDAGAPGSLQRLPGGGEGRDPA
jgi:hypothetical protein